MPTTVHQRATPRVILWPDGQARGKLDVSADVIGFSYTKALQQPAGRWTLRLLPRQGKQGPAHISRTSDLERACRPNGVVSIGFDEPGGIVLGLIDSIRRTRSLAGGRAQVALELSGSDFGKVLASDHIVHASLTVKDTPKFSADVLAITGPEHALLAALAGVWGPALGRDGVPTFLGAKVQDVVDWLLKTGPSMQVPLLAAYGGTGRLGESIAAAASVATWDDGRIWSESPHNFNGTYWNFLRSILDEDFYELFIDTVPRLLFGIPQEIPTVQLTIRPKPFDEMASKFLQVSESPGITWDKLTTRIDGLKHWEIGEHEVLSEDLGISDADVFSYYLVTSEHELIGNPDGLKDGLLYPTVDLYALQRAGLRAYEGRLSLVSADIAAKQKGEADYDREVAAEIVEFRNRLFNWYRLAEYYEAGAITVAGRDRYRIGDPVLLPWRMPLRGDAPGVRFYVISTTHSWSIGAPYTTTLRLMRGHNASTLLRANLELGAAGAKVANPNMVATTG